MGNLIQVRKFHAKAPRSLSPDGVCTLNACVLCLLCAAVLKKNLHWCTGSVVAGFFQHRGTEGTGKIIGAF
ncbi:MAG: hypothetical protein JWQ78_381 [Sediminibacterium sp.]|nr:hypothetical protein [Sediminibacterium sp.]